MAEPGYSSLPTPLASDEQLLRRTDELGPNAHGTLGRMLGNHFLPTPVAGDGIKASTNPATSQRRINEGRQPYLADIVQTELLPIGDEHWLRPGDDRIDLFGTPTASFNVRSPRFRRKGANPAEFVEEINAARHALLKTPLASDKGRVDRPERYETRSKPGGRFDLSDQVAALLPTPTAVQGRNATSRRQPDAVFNTGTTLNDVIYAGEIGALLPTPTAQDIRDSKHLRKVGADALAQGVNHALGLNHLADNGLIGVSLLPTPTVIDMGSNYTPEQWEEWKTRQREAHGNGNGHGASLTQEAITSSIDWGKYGPAIRRWERILDRQAPDPTTPGANDRPRLNPAFVEWMMGLDAGRVTGRGLRPAQELKMLGNGVCPQQAILALRMIGTR